MMVGAGEQKRVRNRDGGAGNYHIQCMIWTVYSSRIGREKHKEIQVKCCSRLYI